MSSDRDEGTQARLAAADPAARLDPLGAMERTTLLDTAASDSGRAVVRRRPVLAWGLGLGAVAVACAVAAALVLAPRPAEPPLVLALPEEDPLTAQCLALGDGTTGILGQADTAFEGTVTALDDATVTLTVDRFLRGGPAGSVQLERPDFEGFVEFRRGGDYLVAAAEGRVFGCGLSGPADSELRAYYDAAYGS